MKTQTEIKKRNRWIEQIAIALHTDTTQKPKPKPEPFPSLLQSAEDQRRQELNRGGQ